MTITDKMVEKAQMAIQEEHNMDGWPPIVVRGMLEAVAPMLIAQGMREAAEISANEEVHWIAELILARAQEIDPK
jgi:hypothetical protein